MAWHRRAALKVSWKFRLLAPALVLASWAAAQAWAEPPAVEDAPADEAQASSEEETKFLRITRDDQDRLLAMETAIVHYVPGGAENDGLSVDLVAAIHVGERDYYEALNEAFKDYDVVLYELVAPEDAVPNREKSNERDSHPIAMLQGGLQRMLELEHQLELVDYEQQNFVHADMSPEEFEQSMRDSGENFMTIFFRMMMHAMKQQRLAAQRNPQAQQQSDAALLAALFNRDGGDRAMMMRQLMAEQFDGAGDLLAALDGPGGSTIVAERNKVAIDVLQKQIEAGKRKIAIFYGAGHMRDFERRLAELELTPDSTRWLTAWKLVRDAKGDEEEAADESQDSTP